MTTNGTKRILTGLGTVGIAVLMLTGTAAAYAVTRNGGSYYIVGSPPPYFTNDPNGTCFQFNNGDTFTFIDLLVLNNVQGAGAIAVTFTLDIYRWVGGARGAHITGTFSVLVAQPTQTVTGQNQQTATYTGWNGPNSCWTFEVYRTMDDGNNKWWSSVVY